MSVTRQMIEDLRIRLGQSRPLAPVSAPAFAIPAPPARVFPSQHGDAQSAFSKQAQEHTTALVGIGHVGTRYATDVVLQFQAELAVAHHAVAEVLSEDWAASNNLLPLKSRVEDHREFLLRPDLGRRLDEPSKERLLQAKTDIDVQPILADGLSAVACKQSGMALLEALIAACQRRKLSTGTPMGARFARVWLQDEIGALVRAKVAIILLGERPGLGTGDGLSAYMVYDPKIGNTDGNRNMISNIHPRGTPPEVAAERLAVLAEAMIAQQTSGVSLDLTGLRDKLGDSAGRGHREPQKRERLIET